MKRTHAISTLAAISLAAPALAQNMGGPMKHVMVSRVGDALMVHVDPDVDTPALRNYNETYDGDASVLDGAWYNAQYGWMAEGVWQPPAGATIWIEQIVGDHDLLAYARHTFAPIFGTAGSPPRIAWNGAMMHNWYATTIPGDYHATYRVYFGDAHGQPLAGYTPGEVTLAWTSDVCPGDLTSSADPGDPRYGIPDNVVDVTDFFFFLDMFAAGDPRADVNHDGRVDVTDFFLYLDAFALGC